MGSISVVLESPLRLPLTIVRIDPNGTVNNNRDQANPVYLQVNNSLLAVWAVPLVCTLILLCGYTLKE